MVKRPASPPDTSSSSTPSSSASGSAASSTSEFNLQTPPRKRTKFDENDLDWLIGDLRKEEAQLILTRLAKIIGEEEIRKQIDIVRHAREQYTAEQVRQQVELFAQLRRLQETPPLFRVASEDHSSGFATPFPGTPGFGFSTPGFATPGGSSEKSQSGLSSARIKGIKSRIANAFKKDQNKLYHIQEDAVDEEVGKAKDYLGRNNHADALRVMEAVTEEIVQRASSVTVKSENFKDIMNWLGKEWIDMFLSSLFELSEDEKEDWFEKLRTWDAHSVDEESFFTCARYAARHMWSNPKLQFILNGGHNETAAGRIAAGVGYEQLRSEIQQLIGFKEPMNLITIRITWLEREKKIDQALNLSLALGLFENAAKFQIKLNDISGAMATAEKIRESSSLFSVAQIARPIDTGLAFRLALNAIVFAFSEALNSRVHSIAQRDQELVMWTLGLAESEGKVNDFLARLTKDIKSKEYLMSVFNLLTAKDKPYIALDLGERILPPFSLDELQSLFKEMKEKYNWIRDMWEITERSLSEEDKAAFLKYRFKILEVIPFCKTINTLPNQMYKVLTGLLNDPVTAEKEQKNEAINARITNVLETTLANVDEVAPLMLLLKSLCSDSRYEDSYRVGHHILNLVKKHQQLEQIFLERWTREKFDFDDQRQKEIQERGTAANTTVLFRPPVRDHPCYQFEKTSSEVFSLLFDIALKSMKRFVRAKQSSGMNDKMDVEIEQETEEEKAKREALLQQARTVLRDIASKIFDYIDVVSTVLSLSGMLREDCLRVSLEMLQGCFEVLKRVRVTARENLEIQEKAKDMEREIQRLVEEKQKPSQEQLQKLKEMRLTVQLQSNLPAQSKLSQESIDKLFYSVGQTMLSYVMVSFENQNQLDPLSQEEVKRLLDLTLENVRSPKHLADIAQSTLAKEPTYAIYFVDQTIPKLRDLYNTWMALVVLETERDLLVEEQSELQYKFKKDLDEPQLTRLEEVLQLIKKFEDEDVLPYYGTGKNASFFHDLQTQLLKLKLTAILRCRNDLITTIETPAMERTVEQEQRLAQELANAQNTLQGVFRNCIQQTTLFSHYSILTSFFVSQTENVRSRYVGYAHPDILLLLELLELSSKESAEEHEIEAIQLVRIDLKSLKDEAQALWDEMQNRQILASEQRDKMRSLELQVRLFGQKYSGCDDPTLQLVSSVKKNLFRQLTGMVSALINNICSKYRTEYLTYEEVLVQAATENTPLLCARQKDKLQILRNQCEQSSLLLERIVGIVLSHSLGPGTVKSVIDQIVTQIGDCNSFEGSNGKSMQEFSTEQLIRLANHLKGILKDLSKIRLERQPMYEEVERLERDQREAAQLRKPFPKDSLEVLKKCRRQISIWKAGVSSKNLDEDSILKYAIEASVVIARSVLERKVALEQAVAHWKNQIAVKEADGGMSDGESLADLFRKRGLEEEARLVQIEAHWRTLGEFFFNWIQSPADIVTLMGVLKSDTDLTIRFAQKNFVVLSGLKSQFEERKPIHEEYERLTKEKNELLEANKTLRPDDLSRWAELHHQVYVWAREASYLQLNPRKILALNKTNSELVLKALFAKISQLNVACTQLTLLNSVSESNPIDTSSVKLEYKALSPFERTELLNKSQIQLNEVIKVLHEQLEACFPYMTEPAHMINTAMMCKDAGQFDCVMKVCLHAIEILLQLEEKREEYASTFRRVYLLEMEKFFATEFRLSFDAKEELLELQKETDALSSQDLSWYQDSKPVQKSASTKRSAGRGYRAHCDFTYVPITLANAQSSDYSQYNYLRSFYNFLGSVTNIRELTPEVLHFRIGRYADVATDSDNFPEDKGAPFVHSNFMQSLQTICSLMIGSLIQQRNQVLAQAEEKKKFGMEVDQQAVDTQIAKFNEDILGAFEKACKYIDDHSLLNSLVSEIINLDGAWSVSRLRNDEFDLSLPIIKLFLSKVANGEKEIREYEDKLISYIKTLSEEVTLNQQRKELDAGQFRQLRELRSSFAELFTFLPCHRMPLDHYRGLTSNLLQSMVRHLIQYRRTKEQELEGMVRQPRLLRGRSLSEEEIKKEFDENQHEQDELNVKVFEMILGYLDDPNHLIKLAEYLFNEKEMKNVITVANKAQDILKLRLADRLRYEGLMKQLVDRSKAQLVVGSAAGGNVPDEVQDLVNELESVRHRLWEGAGHLRQMVLNLADHMIDAARAEGLSEVIEAQSILVFKMLMTVDKFEEVHTLVGDAKWEQEVRDELLAYVHAYDPTLPGSPIRLVQKIELLIREGWWQEALQHRPEPNADDSGQSIEVLKLLWFSVEKHSPKDLDTLVETIEKFTIKEFQKFNLNTMDSILDVMQTRYPKVIFDLYAKGSDIFLTNSSTKKYKLYVDFLIVMKQRLLTVGLVKEWNEFIGQVRKREIRKKVLINLLNVNDL